MNDTVRFIHTADLHLDSPLRSLAARNEALADLFQHASHTVLTRLVDLALKESVDALLIAGDLFDRDQRNVPTAMVLQRELSRLESANIPVFIIWGNHDAEAKLLDVLDFPANVHAFNGRGGQCYFADGKAVVHGVSFSKRQAPTSLLHHFAKPDTHCFNIGMLHTSLTGADGHNDYAPCTVNELLDMGYDYWALGHIHKRSVHSEHPAIVMPGNPLGRHINESGERTVSLVTLQANEKPVIQAINLAPIRFERIRVSIDGFEHRPEAFTHMVNTILQQAAAIEVDHLILRVQLFGATPLRHHYKRDSKALLIQLRTEFEQRDDLWVDSVDVRKLTLHSGESSTSTKHDQALVSQLQSLINDELLNTANVKDTVEQDITKLIRALPAELKDLFESSQQEDLLRSGADWILQHLRQSSSPSANEDLPADD